MPHQTGSRTFQIIANGYTGQIAGERPYSALKITLAVLATIMVLALLWVMFGQ